MSYFRDMFINGTSSSSLTMIGQPTKVRFPSSTRKITEEDAFCCYNCANDQSLVSACTVCNHTGFLKGDHPMVRMVQQIIDSRIKSSKPTASIEISDLQFTLGNNLSRSIAAEIQKIHSKHVCNGCGQDPIRGKRFHCGTCKNYDLCEACNLQTEHAHVLSEVAKQRVTSEKKVNIETQRSMLIQPKKQNPPNSRMSDIH